MKLFAAIVSLAALAEAGFLCDRRHPSVNIAIERFCNKNNLVVPSWDSFVGADGANGQGHVNIVGGCDGGQWIPKKYCRSQFFDMCKDGATSRRYGRNGCQIWQISYPAKPGPKVGSGLHAPDWTHPSDSLIHLKRDTEEEKE